MGDETSVRQSGDLRSFGRRRGRKLSPRQSRLLSELLPNVRVDFADPLALPAPCGRLPAGESQGAQEVWLEIGFGGGEHLVWQAERNPGVLLIGCEPFEDGVVKVLTAIEDKRLSNIRIHPDDARPLLRALPQNAISRVFILFPDPWPKKRHARRRLVSPETLALLARVMRPGAELRIASDIAPYVRDVLAAVRQVPIFQWTAKAASDWRMRPPDWPETRYEAKAIAAGRRCTYLSFSRVAD